MAWLVRLVDGSGKELGRYRTPSRSRSTGSRNPSKIRTSLTCEPSAAPRRTSAALGARARQAHHAIRHRVQPGGRYRLAAGIAAAVGTIVELGQCPLGSGQRLLQRAADPDLRQPADRLDRAVADALAEPLRGAELRTLCERRHTLPCAVAAHLEHTPDGRKVNVVGGGRHRPRGTRMRRKPIGMPALRWAPTTGGRHDEGAGLGHEEGSVGTQDTTGNVGMRAI